MSLHEQTKTFVDYLETWFDQLSLVRWEDVLKQPEKSAVFSVDLTEGFCNEGVLSSPRVKGIVPAVEALFNAAYEKGVRNFQLFEDHHDAEAVEFEAFPAHCVKGSDEAQTVKELTSLHFYSEIRTITKNSLSSSINTELEQWLTDHKEIDTFIIVGDCTDLCVYQLAMFIKMFGNANQRKLRVIIPENCVQTYDMPVNVAKEIGGMAHDGDFNHVFFLYHMALNGIEIVKEIA